MFNYIKRFKILLSIFAPLILAASCDGDDGGGGGENEPDGPLTGEASEAVIIEAFNQLDVDGNGELSGDEIDELIRLGCEAADVDQDGDADADDLPESDSVDLSADADGDGRVTDQECEDDFRDNLIDPNDDGIITLDEILVTPGEA